MPMPMITEKKTLPGLFEEVGGDVLGFGTREFKSENLILPKDYCVHGKHGIGSARQRAARARPAPVALPWIGVGMNRTAFRFSTRCGGSQDDTASPDKLSKVFRNIFRELVSKE